MMRALGYWIFGSLLAAAMMASSAGMAWAQQDPQPWQGPPAPRNTVPPPRAVVPVQPDQPVTPQYPTLQHRAPIVQQEPPVPFVLSPTEQAVLERTLVAWEQRSKEVRTFDTIITRWKYDAVFGKKETDPGVLKYAAPDRGLFQIDGPQPEKWICDGKSIYKYEYEQKQVREYPLPPELQGKSISDGPLPFVFGADAQKLKQRYFLRVITPRDAEDQVWLEAYPRWQRDLADFHHVELILKGKGMTPFAIQIYEPGGKARTVYQFENVVINRGWRLLDNNPFRASVPFGWTKHVEQPPPPAQAGRPANTVR